MKFLSQVDANQKDMGVLAIVGDAVWSLFVRERLALSHDYKSGQLSKETVKFVSAKAQCGILYALNEILEDSEKAFVKRARNASHGTKAKNSTIDEYNKATAFEALLGYLRLTDNQNRLNEIMEFAFDKSK
ncbi:MAG: ribonuclease III [Firmicutes bacterium]|nr:ribonuclease III [Bacillota bacterium]